MGWLRPEDEPFYTRIRDEWDEDEDGRGEIQLEDFELEKICNDTLQMVRLVTYTVRMEHEDVIQRKKKNGGQSSSGNSNTANGLEFLGVKHLTDDKGNVSSEFEIIWAGTPEAAGINNKFNAVVAVKVERVTSKIRYWWTLVDENPNLDTLCDEMTDDEKKWEKRRLLIHTFTEQPSEKKYVRCEVLPVKAEEKKAAAK